jgi:hypothetical protein
MIQGRFSTNEIRNDFSPAGAKTIRACHQNKADSKRLVFRESSKKSLKSANMRAACDKRNSHIMIDALKKGGLISRHRAESDCITPKYSSKMNKCM